MNSFSRKGFFSQKEFFLKEVRQKGDLLWNKIFFEENPSLNTVKSQRKSYRKLFFIKQFFLKQESSYNQYFSFARNLSLKIFCLWCCSIEVFLNKELSFEAAFSFLKDFLSHKEVISGFNTLQQFVFQKTSFLTRRSSSTILRQTRSSSIKGATFLEKRQDLVLKSCSLRVNQFFFEMKLFEGALLYYMSSCLEVVLLWKRVPLQSRFCFLCSSLNRTSCFKRALFSNKFFFWRRSSNNQHFQKH